MPRGQILVLTAVFPEARVIARAFRLAQANSSFPLWLGDEMALAVVGVRAARLADMASHPELGAFQILVVAGVAGALSPGLKVGDVVVDARRVHEPLPPLGESFRGLLHTAGALVTTPDEKARLFAGAGCLGVDMETAIVARFAHQRGAAFVAIRGISDAADETLDPALLTLVDDAGKPRVGRALAMLCQHPAKLQSMLRLGRSTSRAMASVAQILDVLLTSGWHGREAIRRSGS